MALEQRIESLRKRHALIDHIVQQEQTRPAPDVSVLHELKREKLYLKDEMNRLLNGERQAA